MSLLDDLNLDAPEETLGLEQELAALEAAEKVSEPVLPPGFEAAVGAVEAAGVGFPGLAGPAAVAYGQLKNRRETAFKGEGRIGALTIDKPENMVKLAGELAKKAAAATAKAAPAILSPETPASTPETASVPFEDTPKAKAGPGRPRKSAPKETAPVTAEAPVTATAPMPIALFVDCVVNGPATSLSARIDSYCQALAKTYAVADIRSAPAESPLGYGKWKGELAALVRAKPPAPGSYTVDARGSEIAEVVVEALRPMCGMFARGYGR